VAVFPGHPDHSRLQDACGSQGPTLIAGRDESALARIAAQLGADTCHVVPDIDDVLAGDRSRSYRAAVLVADSPRSDDLIRLGRGGRTLVGAGTVVVVPREHPPAATLFFMMEEAVDVCERAVVFGVPQELAALVAGLRPGVRHVRGFCRRHRLSRAETRVFLAACAGLSKVEAHEVLGTSIRTLESHWSSIFTKVGIRCTDGVICAALRDVVFCSRPDCCDDGEDLTAGASSGRPAANPPPPSARSRVVNAARGPR
jgi:DNA-binding CsgD family transcriptional regulator